MRKQLFNLIFSLSFIIPALLSGADDELFKYIEHDDKSVSIIYNWDKPGIIYSVSASEGQKVLPGRELAILSVEGRSKAKLKIATTMLVTKKGASLVPAKKIVQGDLLFKLSPKFILHNSEIDTKGSNKEELESYGSILTHLWHSTGIYDIYRQSSEDFGNTWHLGLGKPIMILIGIVLLYLAIFKGFEPLLLVPIGFGAILANIPLAGIGGPDGVLGMVYNGGIKTGLFPLLIFMGVGSMTDFGPLIANPKTALLGAAAQLGIFFALIGALALAYFGIDFSLKDAASIGIIGGADGPTAIFLTSKLSPKLLGPIAVAAYSYMALVPIIQPPIMRFFTTKEDRQIKMTQLRHVSKLEKISFPVIITLLCAFLLPTAAPLIGMLMFGNLMKESGVVDRLSDTAQNSLINIVTIFLGLAVGSKLSADQFLNVQTLGILLLGMVAFAIGTASGLIFGQIMKKMSGGKINPLIGAAGVSAVPMAARVVNKVGLDDDPHNFLLMHAMGPNVAGVIGSAVAAGVMLKMLENL